MVYEIKSNYITKKKGRWFKWIAWTVLVLILMVVCFGSGMYITQKSEIVKELAKKEVVYLGKLTGKYSQAKQGVLIQDVDFSLFWDVWDTIKRDYVDRDKINEKEMFYGAIRGMVSALGDPYTVFMDPKMAQDFENDLAGTFEGIGAEIGIRDEILTIIAPLEGTPAEKAGLRAGDKVYAIDGESTAGITIDEAVNKIRGPKDSQVTLTIFQNGLDGVQDIVITRGVIVIKSIESEVKTVKNDNDSPDSGQKDEDIYIIRISNFNDDTLSLFNKVVGDILIEDPDGVILDLRNNPGGYLDTAIELASEWIEEGIIVAEQFSETKKNEYLARGRARLKDYPTVVLVNQGSASASEIVAGALRDYEKATIVGKKTFGKGSVQSLKEFGDGSSAKITVAKWLTPNGSCINDEGIIPDVEVDYTLEDHEAGKDPQMDKALEILNNN